MSEIDRLRADLREACDRLRKTVAYKGRGGGWRPADAHEVEKLEFLDRVCPVDLSEKRAEFRTSDKVDDASMADARRWQAIFWRWGSGSVTLDTNDGGAFRMSVEHAESRDECYTGESPQDVIDKAIEAVDSKEPHPESAALSAEKGNDK